MDVKGYKPHEIDQMDIHHLFKLFKQKPKEQKKEAAPTGYIDQIAGW